MGRRLSGKKMSSFQIIVAGFGAVILAGTILLLLPVASKSGQWTSVGDALFTSASALCVTGLVVRDTATYWSAFGQTVILVLIQIGGLGVVSVAAFWATLAGKKISLLQRSMLQETMATHQIGGVVRLISFLFRAAFLIEASGVLHGLRETGRLAGGVPCRIGLLQRRILRVISRPISASAIGC